MDTPSQESGALSLAQAAALYAANNEPEKKPEAEVEPQAQAEQPESNAQPEGDEVNTNPDGAEQVEEGADDKITIEVDGKIVELTKSELADAYKNGLRQSDYTRKTMEVAEQRKAAEAEASKARQEREAYQDNLQKMQAVLETAITQQNQIDWQSLLESDPVEYLKQQHLYQQRQAAYQQNMLEQQRIGEMANQERQKEAQSYLTTQWDKLTERLPEWKNPEVAKSKKAELRSYMLKEGANDKEVDSLTHHLAIVWAEKAMKYDALMSKANVAEKKVAAAPQKVVKPGVAGTANDQRTAAWQKFNKSGSLQDAAALYKQLKSA
ncbi:MAG: hypothetical protein KGL39_36665 [Patescibacteria group bacterium]|nr:hypothetical protein [Patescibacteria group bacterium]